MNYYSWMVRLLNFFIVVSFKKNEIFNFDPSYIIDTSFSIQSSKNIFKMIPATYCTIVVIVNKWFYLQFFFLKFSNIVILYKWVFQKLV